MDQMNDRTHGIELAKNDGEQQQQTERAESRPYPLANITRGMNEVTRRAFETFRIQLDARANIIR